MSTESLTWKEVWHRGIAPSLTIDGLSALKEALETNDKRLVQSSTVSYITSTGEITGGCAIGYCGWQGQHIENQENMKSYFQAVCTACEDVGFEPSIFIRFFDYGSREAVFRELLVEVQVSIADRLEQMQATHNKEVCHA